MSLLQTQWEKCEQISANLPPLKRCVDMPKPQTNKQKALCRPASYPVRGNAKLTFQCPHRYVINGLAGLRFHDGQQHQVKTNGQMTISRCLWTQMCTPADPWSILVELTTTTSTVRSVVYCRWTCKRTHANTSKVYHFPREVSLLTGQRARTCLESCFEFLTRCEPGLTRCQGA